MSKVKEGELIELYKEAIEAEDFTAHCCGHLSSLIKNGRIKAKFYDLSRKAVSYREWLVKHLKDLREEKVIKEDKCRFCLINVDNFSLIGAINLALEVTMVSLRIYKELGELIQDRDIKKILKDILKEKTKQKNFLKRERKFIEDKEEEESLLHSHCLSKIISRFWD